MVYFYRHFFFFFLSLILLSLCQVVVCVNMFIASFKPLFSGLSFQVLKIPYNYCIIQGVMLTDMICKIETIVLINQNNTLLSVPGFSPDSCLMQIGCCSIWHLFYLYISFIFTYQINKCNNLIQN